MERVSLRTAFHGEPDNLEDGAGVETRGPDQVTISVRSGSMILRVPGDVPDNKVISKKYMDEFMQLVLELEDGSQLIVTLDAGDDLADTRLIPAAQRAQASEG
ncbi:MAG: hypothetical protein IT331_16905 [Anaerolineae bacterium]|nr:hypothetical protein [Anaerolineae bacterium]